MTPPASRDYMFESSNSLIAQVRPHPSTTAGNFGVLQTALQNQFNNQVVRNAV